MSDAATRRFFVPGPTEVRREILDAMARPMIPHRSKAFESLFGTLQEGLREVFGTAGTVIISTSSATGMMEGAVRCAPPGAVLALVNGAFSGRFGAISAACGRETEILEAPLGAVVPLDQVEAALSARQFAVVLVVHSETSTGARSDIRAVTDLARRHGALCLVDSVSGIGGIPLMFDAWDLDFVLTGSQKALALPPGLAFAVASERYLRHAATNPTRGRYLDIAELQEFARRNQTPATPALSLMYALEAQLETIRREGMTARWARHAAMAAVMTEWVTRARDRCGHELGILAGEQCRSETVTAVRLPDYLDGSELVAAVATKGYVLGEGYGPLRARTVRVGHMGDHTVGGLRKLLAVVDDVLARSGSPHQPARG
jgi:aspartate aminotransferase-like enzyme